jgi:hypothetical protein
MGFDYKIIYKPGRDNTTVDALSTLPKELNAITCPQHEWLSIIHCEAREHPEMVAVKEAMARGASPNAKYQENDGLVWYKGRLVLPAVTQYKEYILREFHDTPVGGHSGGLHTYK